MPVCCEGEKLPSVQEAGTSPKASGTGLSQLCGQVGLEQRGLGRGGALQVSNSSGLHLLLSSQGQPKGSSPFLLQPGSNPQAPGTLREEEFASFPQPLVPA